MMKSVRVIGLLFSLAIMLIITCQPSLAAIEEAHFDRPIYETRYKGLIAEFRCLVCQNQNLADSNADLAKDLRRKTAEMLNAGKSDDEIRDYMRLRYGDFVSYRPSFKGGFLILWLGPIILLLLVVLGIVRFTRQREEDEILKPSTTNNEAQRTQVRNLMRDAPSLSKQPKDH